MFQIWGLLFYSQFPSFKLYIREGMILVLRKLHFTFIISDFEEKIGI